MSFGFSSLTDTYGYVTTTTPDGSGGLNLTCPKFGTLNVPAGSLPDPETRRLLQAIYNEQDFVTNWTNLASHLNGVG